jgi:hypothetical protein
MLNNINSRYWRGRAEKTRALAVNDPRSESRMLRLADFYERLAEKIDQHAKLHTWRKLRPRGVSPGSK